MARLLSRSSLQVVGTAGLLVVGALIAGCGFQPLYGGRGAVTAASVTGDFAQVRIEPIADRAGQLMRNYLLDRLNPAGGPASPRYELKVELSTSKALLGIRKDETATRANMTVTAQFRLTELASGAVVYRSSSTATTSYNIVDADFSTIAADQDAVRRGLVQLADAVTLRLALFFNRRRSLAR